MLEGTRVITIVVETSSNVVDNLATAKDNRINKKDTELLREDNEERESEPLKEGDYNNKVIANNFKLDEDDISTLLARPISNYDTNY